MSFISVDVEADGPVPPLFSMVSFGAVIIEPTLTKTFYGQTKPISDRWDDDALVVSGFFRGEHEKFDDPQTVMENFDRWIKENSIGNPVFVSDNPAFDWQWINFYFHFFLGRNPFGHSARRIGDLYCGMMSDASKNHEWKKRLRITKHNHHPVQDAISNAEAVIGIQKLGLKIKLL